MALVVMKRVLITGGSSGVGLEASRLLLLSGHQLTLCCRSQDRCEQTQQTLLNAGADPDLIDYLVVDQADLQSVSQACQQLLQQGNPIDFLVLNAGQQRAGDPNPAFSAQGIELTFAVNQLAHQWMLMQLLPLLKATPQPRLVITASDVHDPATGGGRVGQPAGLGDLAGLKCGAGFVMLDGNDRFDGEKAYKDSKLCNVLMGREIDRQQQGALAWSFPRAKAVSSASTASATRWGWRSFHWWLGICCASPNRCQRLAVCSLIWQLMLSSQRLDSLTSAIGWYALACIVLLRSRPAKKRLTLRKLQSFGGFQNG